MIVEYELDGVRWFVVSRQFPSPEIARLAWQAIQAEGRRQRGALSLGVYRHGPSDGDQNIVTAVSRRPDGILVADRLLSAPDFDLPDEWAQALILRRVSVVDGLIARRAATAGSYVLRRGRAGTLDLDGTMRDYVDDD